MNRDCRNRVRDTTSVSRRGFVALGAAAMAGTGRADALLVLTREQAQLVDQITEQIVPADADAGANQAGVVNYIDRQLAGPLAQHAPLYREGLSDFEPMRRMDFDRQKAFLQAVEKGAHGIRAARLFGLLVDHTMQGFYGDPKHGGNRGETSWKMLGIEEQMGGGSH